MKYAIRLCIVFLFVLGLTGCLGGGIPKDAVKIGAMLPLTGSFADYGTGVRSGMELALETLNARRAERGEAPIYLTILDTESDARIAVKQYEWLVAAGYPVVIGPGATSEALRLQRATATAKVPLVLPIATGDVLTAKDDYILRSCFTDDRQARALAVYLRENLGLERIGVMIDLHNDGAYGRNLGQNLARYFKELGGTVVRTEGFRNEDLYFTRALESIIKRNPQAIFMPATAATAGRMAREARLLGFDGWLVGGDSLAETPFIASCNRDSGKILFSSQFSNQLGTPEVSAFNAAMLERTGRLPGDCEAQGYDTLLLVADVLTAGAPAEFRQRWEALREYPLLTGITRFDDNGDADRPVFFNRIEVDPAGRVEVRLDRPVTP